METKADNLSFNNLWKPVKLSTAIQRYTQARIIKIVHINSLELQVKMDLTILLKYVQKIQQTF